MTLRGWRKHGGQTAEVHTAQSLQRVNREICGRLGQRRQSPVFAVSHSSHRPWKSPAAIPTFPQARIREMMNGPGAPASIDRSRDSHIPTGTNPRDEQILSPGQSRGLAANRQPRCGWLKRRGGGVSVVECGPGWGVKTARGWGGEH